MVGAIAAEYLLVIRLAARGEFCVICNDWGSMVFGFKTEHLRILLSIRFDHDSHASIETIYFFSWLIV